MPLVMSAQARGGSGVAPVSQLAAAGRSGPRRCWPGWAPLVTAGWSELDRRPETWRHEGLSVRGAVSPSQQQQ